MVDCHVAKTIFNHREHREAQRDMEESMELNKTQKALMAHTIISRLEEEVCQSIWQSIEGQILLKGLDGFVQDHQGKMSFNVEIIRTGNKIKAVVEQVKDSD